MPYHEVADPFQTAQNVLFEQLRKAGAEKQRAERQAQETQSMHDYLSQQVRDFNEGNNNSYPGYGSPETNKAVEDSMNEKLADKGISVDNVDTKHVSDETQDMTLANRPTTDDKVQANMNDKLNDKGISVDNVNTDPMKNVEHVTMDRQESTTAKTGVGNATTTGTDSTKLSTKPTTPKTDSPLGDMESMGKMKTSTSTGMNSTLPKPETSPNKLPNAIENKTTTEPKKSTTETNESIKSSMNDKLSDKGIKVGSVNSEAVKGKDVNPVKNVNPPKTEQKRLKNDSGYVTRTVPNKPSAHIKK